MCAWRHSGSRTAEETSGSAERRALGLLLEGAAINQVQVDQADYRRFRSAILRDSIRLTDPQLESDLLQTIGTIVREFENYRIDSEAILDSRQKEWRQITGMLLNQLAEQDSIDRQTDLWTAIGLALASASTSEEIQLLRVKLQQLFQRTGAETAARLAELREEQDRSTANDNAAGLRGGGAAVEHVRAMLAGQRPGFVGVFRLCCLDVVGERFGVEGIQDCLMAVSAFLTQNLRSEDTIYHWTDSSLLAVCDRKVREDMLAAELNRVLSRNRDFTISIGDRAIMMRIPIELQLFPMSHFASADDLHGLPTGPNRGDRTLSARAPVKLGQVTQ